MVPADDHLLVAKVLADDVVTLKTMRIVFVAEDATSIRRKMFCSPLPAAFFSVFMVVQVVSPVSDDDAINLLPWIAAALGVEPVENVGTGFERVATTVDVSDLDAFERG